MTARIARRAAAIALGVRARSQSAGRARLISHPQRGLDRAREPPCLALAHARRPCAAPDDRSPDHERTAAARVIARARERLPAGCAIEICASLPIGPRHGSRLDSGRPACDPGCNRVRFETYPRHVAVAARETGLQATGSAILSPTARVSRQGLVSRERRGQGKPFYVREVPERGMAATASDPLSLVPQVAQATSAAGSEPLPASARGGRRRRRVGPSGLRARARAWSARRNDSCAA